MFKKFTDTLSGTIDTVKSYGSSMGLVQPGQQGGQGAQRAQTNTGINNNVNLLPMHGNGSMSSAPSQNNSLASSTVLGLQSTLRKITGRNELSNPVVVASHQRGGRGPMLGMAVETNESRITDFHNLSEEHRVSSYHDITSFEQYKRVSDAGALRQLESKAEPIKRPAVGANMNGTPKLVRSNTDEIIDQEFAAAKVNLDDVLDMPDYVDELSPTVKKEEEEEKKKKKRKDGPIQKCIRCLQDNRVKGGCVAPEEILAATEQHMILKKVLNIVFVVVGILLFAAVFIVIIYTTYVDPPAEPTEPPSFYTDLPFNVSEVYYDYTVDYEPMNKPEPNWLYR